MGEELQTQRRQLAYCRSNNENARTTEIEIDHADECFVSDIDDDIIGTFPIGQDSQETCLESQDMFSLAIDDESQSVKSQSSTLSRKRRVHKASHSPKKWRRMIRSQRLQSILLTN